MSMKTYKAYVILEPKIVASSEQLADDSLNEMLSGLLKVVTRKQLYIENPEENDKMPWLCLNLNQ